MMAGYTRHTLDMIPTVRDMYLRGCTQKAVINRTGLSNQTVSKLFKDFRESRPIGRYPIPLGRGCGTASLLDLNPVDGFWCNACDWSGVVRVFDTDVDTLEPDTDAEGDYAPRFCPNCGRKIDWKGAA